MQPSIDKIPRDRLLIREIITALGALVALSWLALLLSAPLSGPGGAGVPTETAVRAPWIFVGLQVLLGWLPPLLGGILLPLSAVAFLALLPLENRLKVPSRVSMALFAFLLLITTTLTLYGFLK